MTVVGYYSAAAPSRVTHSSAVARPVRTRRGACRSRAGVPGADLHANGAPPTPWPRPRSRHRCSLLQQRQQRTGQEALRTGGNRGYERLSAAPVRRTVSRGYATSLHRRAGAFRPRSGRRGRLRVRSGASNAGPVPKDRAPRGASPCGGGWGPPAGRVHPRRTLRAMVGPWPERRFADDSGTRLRGRSSGGSGAANRFSHRVAVNGAIPAFVSARANS